MKNNNLKEINGNRIRRQYFNIIIYIYLGLLLELIILFATCEIALGRFEIIEYIKSIRTAFALITAVLLPFVILSLLNRFCFGKTLCVLNDDGLHFSDGCIKWNEIKEMHYNMTSLSKYHFSPAFVTVICGNKEIKLNSVPLFLFKYVKKYNPDIKIKKDNTVFFIVAVITAISIFLPFIAVKI